MNATHLTAEQAAAWRERTLPGPERLAALAHAGDCEACRALLAGPPPAEGPLRAAVLGEGAADEHLSEETLAAYLERRLDSFDRETTEAHLADCPECAAEAAELRAFRAEASTWTPRVHAPGAAERPRPRRRLPALWAFGLPGAAVAAGVVAVVFLQGSAVTLRDGGGEVRLARNGALSGLPDLPAGLRGEVVAVLRGGTPATPAALAGLQPPAALGPAPFHTTGPAGTVVADVRPTFTWELPAGATACRVRFLSADGEQLLETKPLKEERWKPKKALTPGREYRWQVVAVAADGREVARFPQRPDVARFRVLAADRAAALARDRQALAGSHLALGLRYLQEGLLPEAEGEFAVLRAANPDSAVASRLEAAVRALRAPVAALA